MASLVRRPSVLQHVPTCSQHRHFASALPRLASLQWQSNHQDALADTVPAYPHGSPQWYKQSRSGLYGGQRVQFGNNVSGRFETKTRRQWHPNIRAKKLYSRALGRTVQIRVSTRVLKTIDKLGGLDEYLLGEKEARIKELGESGWWLRWAVMQTKSVRERFNRQRETLGLPIQKTTVEVIEEELADGVSTTAAVLDQAAAEQDTLDPDAAEQELAESEEIATDGAFQIETSPEMPPLRFRVGPRQHIMLTTTGWRRSLAPRKQSDLPNSRKLKFAVSGLIPAEVLTTALQQAKVDYYVEVEKELVTSKTEATDPTDAETGPATLSADETVYQDHTRNSGMMVNLPLKKIDHKYVREAAIKEIRRQQVLSTKEEIAAIAKQRSEVKAMKRSVRRGDGQSSASAELDSLST